MAATRKGKGRKPEGDEPLTEEEKAAFLGILVPFKLTPSMVRQVLANPELGYSMLQGLVDDRDFRLEGLSDAARARAGRLVVPVPYSDPRRGMEQRG